jgi:double-stranded uracil-DNA glycosylase
MEQPQKHGQTKYGLAAVARKDARLFILGSLPGDASLAAKQYYAHPRNAFWRLVGGVIEEDLESLSYPARLDRLIANRIGLWDVVAHARRLGSLDQAIRSAGHNPLSDYFSTFPDLEAVAFNGAKAAVAGRPLLSGMEGLALIELPSSSPANTRPFDEKAAAWDKLRRFFRTYDLALAARSAKLAGMNSVDESEIETGADRRLSMVDEALVAGTIANTNGLLVILAKLVAKGVFDRDDLKSFSDSYSKPLDHVGMRENELVGQMQDQMESTLAELIRFLSERDSGESKSSGPDG